MTIVLRYFLFLILYFKFRDASNHSEHEQVITGISQRLVMFDVFILDISSFNEKDMDFRIDMNIKHSWVEDYSLCEKCDDCDHGKLIDPKGNVSDELKWIPDTYIANSKIIKNPSTVVDLEMLKLTRVEGFCRLDFVSRVLVIVACQMDFHWYPFDIQDCQMKMQSFRYPENQLKYEWDNSYEVAHDPTVVHKHTFLMSKSMEYNYEFNDRYCTPVINFRFERMAGNYIAQIYAPSVFLLLVSWFAFWMGHRSANITDRITLLVTILLTMVTQFSGFRQDLPPISYVTGIDVWMSGCLFFMFLSLLETVMVCRSDTLKTLDIGEGAMKRKIGIPTTAGLAKLHSKGDFLKITHLPTKQNPANNTENKRHHQSLVLHSKMTDEDEFEDHASISKMDRACRFIFPTTFTIFCIIYFISLLSEKIKHHLNLAV